MTDEPMPETPETALADTKPVTKRFRRRFDAVRLAPEAAERQGRAARFAWEVLGDREAAIAFLNTHDEALGGRPIDLAVASVAGLKAVERRLAERREPGAG